jgi:hypothetical protein
MTRYCMAVSLTLLSVLSFGAVAACSAVADGPAPGWEVTASTLPSHLAPGHDGNIVIELYNVGAAPSGSPTVTDTLPTGLRFTGEAHGGAGANCTGTAVVTCALHSGVAAGEMLLAPGGTAAATVELAVTVEPGAPEGTVLNRITVEGGGASAPARTSEPIAISSTPAGAGFANFDGWLSNADGTIDTQVGSHPYELGLALDLNAVGSAGFGGVDPAGGQPKLIKLGLPPGLIGDPGAVPQCTRAQFDIGGPNGCPLATQVGVDHFGLGGVIVTEPIYNLVPPPGSPAQVGFEATGFPQFYDTLVRSGSDYGITQSAFIQPSVLTSNTAIIWGVPSDPSHNAGRLGPSCGGSDYPECSLPTANPMPFLTLPTTCAAPPVATVKLEGTWNNSDAVAEDSFEFHDGAHTPVGMTGCEHLSFKPLISAAPDTSQADTPAGLTVTVRVPQEGLTEVGRLAGAAIKDTTVTLPEGIVINPGQAAGLAACQEAEAALHSDGPQSCPGASKVGEVKIKTPLLEVGVLEHELAGNVYVLQSNPPNLKLLLAASGDGVNLKVVGTVHLDEQTGRLTTTFSNTPELPFTELKLSFSGGAQAALVTPTACGVYHTESDFTPSTTPFGADAFPSSNFAITGGADGAPCPPSPLPFTPSMIAGATTDQAGGYTNFSLLLQSADDQQRISSLEFKTPPGLLAMISRVPLCPEPLGSEGDCPAASQIGHTVVASGPGPYPLVVPGPGRPPAPIYITGPHNGAPFGLSIVVPVIAGPFRLGTKVVRAAIAVDPHTAQITVRTDPSGPHAIPPIIDGVPTDLRTINAVIDRPGFMFNPTNCAPMSFSGTATSTEGASAPLSSHFQVGSCQALKFKPNFTVSASGRTSRTEGASLDAKLVYPTGALGDNQAASQANIKSVKVELPKQLPSRLTTLQKACTGTVFNADPASCPAASVVGHASAITPELAVPLMGPVYFVSHGGESFPTLILVLQGDGVTVELEGTTFISKAGITSSTFETVPDVPISSFELVLPQGPFSALAANGDLCTSSLVMPTSFVAQNGAELEQNTKITVTGCPKAAHAATKHRSRRAKRAARRRRR